MLTREQYKELKRYEDSEIPIGDEGLSEIEEYLLNVDILKPLEWMYKVAPVSCSFTIPRIKLPNSVARHFRSTDMSVTAKRSRSFWCF